MNANRIAKEAKVKEILKKIKNSSAIVIVEYAGLAVKEIQELKTKLKKADVEIKVYKNRLVKLAIESTELKLLAKNLVGPNAFVFGTKDDIAPAKILFEYAKKHKALKLKIGTYEGKVIDLEALEKIATLPSMEEALKILAISMLAPINQMGKGLYLLASEGHLTN